MTVTPLDAEVTQFHVAARAPEDLPGPIPGRWPPAVQGLHPASLQEARWRGDKL